LHVTAAVSMLVPKKNCAVMVLTPSALEELICWMPLTRLTAFSIGRVMSVSICSGPTFG